MKVYKFTILFLIAAISYSFAQYSNIAVTTNTYDQSEPTIAVSPLNSNIVLAAWNDHRDDDKSKPGYAFSTNAGQTWTEGITLPSGYFHGFDPSVAFDRYGNAFYCYIAKNPNDIRYGRVYISKTNDLGNEWDKVGVSDNLSGGDKPWITADNTEGDYDGRLYFSWTEFQLGSRIKFRYSSDHGSTFSDEIILDQENESQGYHSSINPWDTLSQEEIEAPSVQGSMPAVAPNGDVYVIWMDYIVANPSVFRIKKIY